MSLDNFGAFLLKKAGGIDKCRGLVFCNLNVNGRRCEYQSGPCP